VSDRRAGTATLGAWLAVARRRAIMRQLCARATTNRVGAARRRLFLAWTGLAAVARRVGVAARQQLQDLGRQVLRAWSRRCSERKVYLAHLRQLYKVCRALYPRHLTP